MADISQLLAFADSIVESGLASFREDLSPLSSAEIPEPITWRAPPPLWELDPNAIAPILSSLRKDDVGVEIRDGSPSSPLQKARTSLFGASDKPLELETCGEIMDPRGVIIIDHPGRHAQFKHWYHAGFLTDDTRRLTLRDEGTKSSPLSMKKSSDIHRSGSPEGILGLLMHNRSDPAKNDVNTFFDTLKQSDEEMDEQEHKTAFSSDRIMSPGPSAASWKSKTFLMGTQLMVAMGETGMCDGDFPAWCAWFTDLMFSHGLSDRAVPLSSAPLVVNADIDFSRNALGDGSVQELVRVLSSFKRIHVRTLRICNNAVTDSGLADLVELPFVQQLFLSENLITRQGLIEFVISSRKNKQDVYEASVAQDRPDESLLRPSSVFIEGNFVENAITVLDDLRRIGVKACCIESSGCDFSTPCKVFPQDCGVHLSGIGCQRKQIFS